jgi:hypothetical protein
MKSDDLCPDKETVLQALAENQSPATVEHVHTCSICKSNPELQAVLSTWQLLDALPEIQVSGNFEARLQSRLQQEKKNQLHWLRLDAWFDFLHIPALAIVLAGLIWLPQTESTIQAHHWERPKETQSIKEHFPVKTDRALIWLKKMYTQRNVNG